MQQLVILSGKGGTGKTTVASAFIRLSNAKAYADCDVDAPNLHLIYKSELTKETDYFGLKKAVIDASKCVGCGKCSTVCKFDAIVADGTNYKVSPYDCEGCGVCELVCKADAITMQDSKAGDLRLYKAGDSVFSTAELKMGSGTSGKLVTEVKRQLKDNANCPLAIIDGSPGIGCPVIATVSGANAVLIVAEPSLSGISDLDRIVKTAERFMVKVFVCVNKYDINLDKTNEIEQYCLARDIMFVGKIPYDKQAVSLTNKGKSVVDEDCKSGNAIKEIYNKVITNL